MIFAIQYIPNIVTVSEDKWNGRDSDELHKIKSRFVKVQKGTILNLYSCSLHGIEEFKDVFKQMQEFHKISWSMGFQSTPPLNFDTNVSLDKNIATMLIEENIETSFILPKEIFFSVHNGIRGWYITGVSNLHRISIPLHKDFAKYGFLDAELKNPMELEDGEKGDAQDLYEKYIDKSPDKRYRV